MDDRGFDALAKALATPQPRRRILRALLLAAGGGIGAVVLGNPGGKGETVETGVTLAQQQPTHTPKPSHTPKPTKTPKGAVAPSTNTAVPPTRTSTTIPTNTAVPPTNTAVPPTNTAVPPTNTPTNTAIPTDTPTPIPTNTTVPTNTAVPPTSSGTSCCCSCSEPLHPELGCQSCSPGFLPESMSDEACRAYCAANSQQYQKSLRTCGPAGTTSAMCSGFQCCFTPSDTCAPALTCAP